MPPPAVLMYNATEPPIAVLAIGAACSDAKAKLKIVPKGNCQTMISIGKDRMVGVKDVCRYLARAHDEVSTGLKLYGNSILDSTQVDFFLDLSEKLASKVDLAMYCDQLNSHLEWRQYLVGGAHTVADFVIYGELKNNARFPSLMKQGKHPYLARWFTFLENLKELQTPLAAANKKRADKVATKKANSSSGSYRIALKDAEVGKVVTRFPPEPSGYLHIGHAKALLLNDYFARSYEGKMLLRFDDTNPQKEKQEYVDNIIKDLETLGIKYAQPITNSSDYFDQLLQLAKKFILDGHGYCDNTPKEQMRAERMDGIESKFRSQSIEENMRMFEEMIAGSEEGLKCVLRAKIDMQNNNKTLRDPTMYRCNLNPHHRTGTKYKVYPTYDFACPIIDSIEGVTHAMRTNEYRDRNAQYAWVQEATGVRKVNIWDYSRLNFVYTLLSKRKLNWFVENGLVEGWHDPRFPTVQGILRRGMTVQTLKEFMYLQGASVSSNLMEWDKIWALNKKMIDPVIPRYTSVTADKRVELFLSNFGENTATSKNVPLHPKNKDLGEKALIFSEVVYLEQADAMLCAENEEVTLMNWGNAIITKITKDANGNVTRLDGKLHLEGDFKKTKKKLHWLSASVDSVALQLVAFDHLITATKLDEGDNFQDFLTPQTRFETPAIGEPALRSLKEGDFLQLQRIGNYRCDRAFNAEKPEDPVVLFFIPDGKSKSMSVVGTANKNKK